jgi:hypothetical protein
LTCAPVALPAGCTAGALFSATTGLSCAGAVVTLPAGCTTSAGFSPTTGASCATGAVVTTGPLVGGAGDVTITETSTDVEDTALEGQATKVLGFKAEASDSDVAITNIKVTLENTNAPTTSYRLTNYVDSVDVYMGSTKVGSANASDFSKVGYVYSKSIALTDAIVREGTSHKATFYVVLNATSSIDSTDMAGALWDVTASNIRFQDATGVIMTNGDPDPAVVGLQFSDLATSGDVKLTISKGSGSPVAQSVEVSDTSSTPDVLMLEFKLKAAGSDLSFDQLTLGLTGVVAGANTLATMITDMSLVNGSDTLASDPTISAADTGTAVFTLDDTFTISKDTTETFKVYAKVAEVGATTLTSGDSLLVSLVKTQIATEDANGDVVLSANETGSATGAIQTFSTSGIVVGTYSWVVNATGTVLDFFFTVDNSAGDAAFDVVTADVNDALGSGSTGTIRTDSDVYETDIAGVVTWYSGDAVTPTASTKYTVAVGDTATFRVRYSLGDSATTPITALASNGKWVEVLVNSVAGETVTSTKVHSPMATVNL